MSDYEDVEVVLSKGDLKFLLWSLGRVRKEIERSSEVSNIRNFDEVFEQHDRIVKTLKGAVD